MRITCASTALMAKRVSFMHHKSNEFILILKMTINNFQEEY